MASLLNDFSIPPWPRKITVPVPLHPIDNERAREAAQKCGMAFEDFCALAIHLATRDSLQRG